MNKFESEVYRLKTERVYHKTYMERDSKATLYTLMLFGFYHAFHNVPYALQSKEDVESLMLLMPSHSILKVIQ